MKKLLLNLIGKIFRITSVGIPVIIQNSKGEILLGKRDLKQNFYPNYWGLPGGILNYNEKIEDCAKREVKEEFGVEIKVLKKSKNIYEIIPSENYAFHTISPVIYAKITRGSLTPKDETSEIKWFNKREIKKMNLAYNHKKILIGEGMLNDA
ncbi:NUDIX hydrolase [Candidatus Pacearchaeota archaeon]|jgi:ADP-ribose pyrophosphatase YjhB (NUDIX family)|nr:NUDIX hydrolase [Candidatus Pacearchaeota archaeon]